MLVSLIAVSITAVVSFNFAEQLLKERVGDQLTTESTIRGEAFESLFDKHKQQAKILSTNPRIKQILTEFNNLEEKEGTELMTEELSGAFVTEVFAFMDIIGNNNAEKIEDVQIYGKNNKELFSLHYFRQGEHIVESLKSPSSPTDSSSWINYTLGSDGEKYMLTMVPVFGGTEKAVIGSVVLVINPVETDQILLNREGLGNTGEAYIVNENKIMVSKSRFIEDASFSEKVDTVPVRECFNNNLEVNGVYKDYRDVSIYGVSHCVEEQGFVLLVEMDESEILEPITALQNNIIITGILVTLGVGVVASLLSKLISKPIIKLRDAADAIAKGNFGVKTDIRTNDEISQLSHSFDTMSEKIQDSLNKIDENERIIQQQKDILLQFSNFSQNFCVCIVDIVGSTKISAGLADSDISNYYQVFLNTMATTAKQFGAIVVKNVGDSLLYYFPKTNSIESNSFKDVLECCLTMLDNHPSINEQMKKQGLPRIDYKISATYGSVRIAKITTSSIDDIFGSTVNICSKINSMVRPNSFLIDHNFYQIVKDFDDYAFQKDGEYSLPSGQSSPLYSVTRKHQEV